MRKTITLLLAVCMLFSLGITAGAVNYVTDGTNLYIAGDADNNGETNLLDLVKTKIYSDGNSTEGVTAAAIDLNGDGKVDGEDLALIRAILLGIDKREFA